MVGLPASKTMTEDYSSAPQDSCCRAPAHCNKGNTLRKEAPVQESCWWFEQRRVERVGTDEARGGLAPFLNCHGGSDPQPSRDSHLGVQYYS